MNFTREFNIYIYKYTCIHTYIYINETKLFYLTRPVLLNFWDIIAGDLPYMQDIIEIVGYLNELQHHKINFYFLKINKYFSKQRNEESLYKQIFLCTPLKISI